MRTSSEIFDSAKPPGLHDKYAILSDKKIGAYPGFVTFASHKGRTSRAKYSANPSRRPLNVAVPEEVASALFKMSYRFEG